MVHGDCCVRDPSAQTIQGDRSMKMTFHFVRIPDSDVTVEGTSIADCTQKAVELRSVQCMPTKIAGEVSE